MMSMRTLDEIDADFAALDALLEELHGDVTGQEAALDAMVAELHEQRDDKLHGYRHYLAKLEAGVAWKKAEEQRLASRRKTEEGRIAWLKARLLAYVQTYPEGKITTPGGTFSAQRNPPSVEMLVLPEELPELYRREIVTHVTETDRIRIALKAGVELPFARFRAPSFHLRIR
jgi:hypothetical protein